MYIWAGYRLNTAKKFSTGSLSIEYKWYLVPEVDKL